jgi:GT2 family glycosyltransferase
MIDISTIVVNLNTRELLRACLASVFAEESPLHNEVIVIDNGSTDGSTEMVIREFPSVRLVVNPKNEGFARPNNVGMQMATGRHLFLLNSDAALHHGALGRLSTFLDNHPDAGACGPRLVHPDGRLQRSARGFPDLWTHTCDMFFLDKLFPGSRVFGRGEMGYFSYDRTQEVDHVMAAAFLVRREVLATAGAFDERFSIYYNDMDWCYRIKEHGWKIYYVHDAVVTHHGGATVAAVNLDFSYFHELYDNVMLFYQKRYGRPGIVAYRLILAAGFLLRSLAWSIRWLVHPTEYTRMMMVFSWRSLATGARFWVPVKA